MENHCITRSILIYASPETVYDALTDPGELVKFYPLKEVVSEWRVGSGILFRGEANGRDFVDHGTIEALSRPARFSYRYWSDNHGTERTPENHLWITYTLEPDNNGTRLRLEQSNFKSKEMFDTMNLVWDSLLGSLKAHLERQS